MMRKATYALLAAALSMAFSCSKEEKAVDPDALASVGTFTLSKSDLRRSMPAGLSTEDSAKYARAFIKQWIDDRMMSTIAAEEIDLTEINKMVDQYRTELIAFEYAKRMYESHAEDIAPDSIEAYYNAHADEFVLTRPMVKGVYLKVADDADELPTLRRLYKSDRDPDIDKLEKSALSGAVHYDYFRDRWVDWDQIESRVPYQFGPAEAFLRTRSLDFSQGGFTYLLFITDALRTGQKMPLEAATPLIQERLRYAGQREYLNRLKRELLENAISDGKIAIFCELGS